MTSTQEPGKLEVALTAGLRRVALRAAKQAFDDLVHGPRISSPDDVLGTPADYLSVLERELGPQSVRWSAPLDRLVRAYLFGTSTLHIRVTQLLSAYWLEWLDPGPEQIAELTRRDLLEKLQIERRANNLAIVPTMAELEALDDVVAAFMGAAKATAEELRGQYQMTDEMSEALVNARPNSLTTAAYMLEPVLPPATVIRRLIRGARRYVHTNDAIYTMNFFAETASGPIESLHVVPRLLHIGETGSPGEGAYGEVPFVGLLQGDRRRWVVLGDPGAGKSSLCKRISYHVASDTDFPNVIPVRIKARNLSGIHTVAELEDYLIDVLRPHVTSAIPSADARLQKLLFAMLVEHGHILLIVDGLDEVVEIGNRRALCKVLEQFGVLKPEARVIASSRRQGYEEARLAGYSESRLLSLDFTRINTIAEITCRARNAEHRLGGLLAAIEEHYTELGDLFSNPLQLCLISSLYQVHNSLPSSRAEIYEGSAELFTKDWDKHRNIESSAVDATIHDALGAIASELIKLEAAGEPGISRDRLAAVLKVHFRKAKVRDPERAADLADALASNLAGRSWMLVATSHGRESLGFQHRTFLEYYYAYSLVELRDRELVKEFRGLLVDRVRWATTIDLVMLLLRRARRLDSFLDLFTAPSATAEIPLGTVEARNLALAILHSCRSHPVAFRHVNHAVDVMLADLDAPHHEGRVRQSSHRSLSDVIELGVLLGSVCSDAIDTVFESLLGALSVLTDTADELLLFSSAYLRIRDREDLLNNRADLLTLVRSLVKRSPWRIDHKARLSLDAAALFTAYAGGVLGSVGLMRRRLSLLEPLRVGYRTVTPASLLLDLMDDDYLGIGRPSYRHRLPALLVEVLPKLVWPVDIAAASVEGIGIDGSNRGLWPDRPVLPISELPSEFLTFVCLMTALAEEVDALVLADLGTAVATRFSRVGLPDNISDLSRKELRVRGSRWGDYLDTYGKILITDNTRNQTSG